MKEITVKFADPIANQVKAISTQVGITSEELIRFIVGRWIQQEFIGRFGPVAGPTMQSIPPLVSIISNASRQAMKQAASRGEIKCKNCTFPLTPEDIDNGTCHTCHSPIELPSEDVG